MATITDFQEWIDQTDLDDYNDVYSLYMTVYNLENWGGYQIQEGHVDGQYFLKGIDAEDTLMLASEKARNAFLKKIETDCCNGEDIEAWYGFHHAMEKDD